MLGQGLLTGIIVLAAAVYSIRALRRMLSGKAGCGCGAQTCPKTQGGQRSAPDTEHNG